METNKNESQRPGSAKEGIFQTNQNFVAAMARGDAKGVADCYTNDAQFMAPGAPAAVGRENIAKIIQTFIDQGITVYTVLATNVYGNVDVVGVTEAYSLSEVGGGNKDVGKSVQLWKQEDGAWKIFRDCFNSDLTA